MGGFEVSFATADLHDQHEGKTQVAAILWRSYGGKARFCGPVSTLKCFEDNSLVRPALEEEGAGRVLVIDGGGSVRCALVGDQLAQLAIKNGWAGIVVHGCVRDSAILSSLYIGIKALGTNPKRSLKKGGGERDVAVSFGGVDLAPGAHLYADEDGVLVSPAKLL